MSAPTTFVRGTELRDWALATFAGAIDSGSGWVNFPCPLEGHTDGDRQAGIDYEHGYFKCHGQHDAMPVSTLCERMGVPDATANGTSRAAPRTNKTDARAASDYPQRDPDSRWSYDDADGTVVLEKRRWDLTADEREQHGKRKLFARSPTGVKQPLLLRYRLALATLAAKLPLIITEGEACADAFYALKFNATTPENGWRDGHAELIPKGARRIYVAADNDTAGEKQAAKVAETLLARGCEVFRLELPWNGEPPAKGDAVDWVAEGHGRDDAWAAIANAKPWTVSEDGTKPAGTEWPEPKPVPELPTVPHMSPELLPEPLRAWCVDAADRASIPLEMIAIPAMVAAASIVGRTVGIRPEPHDTWTVVPNLWGGVVTPPGWMKSYAVSEALRPLRRLAADAMEKHEAAAERNAPARLALEGERHAEQQRIRRTTVSDIERTNTATQLVRIEKKLAEFDAPARRHMTQDATTEKLAELLRDNPRGLLLARDELAGWLRSMERAGREGDREFYLESWNGDGSYTIDRIGRGTIHVPALTLSIVGGIQPGKLRRYIEEAEGDGDGADGLLQRLQLLVWPDKIGKWSPSTAPADPHIRARAEAVYAWLDADLPRRLSNLEAKEGPSGGFVSFGGAAPRVWQKYRGELEGRLRSGEMDAQPAFAAHLAKYRSLMPSLALIVHLVDVAEGRATGGVGESAALCAVDWCQFLEQHAAKVYEGETAPSRAPARSLLKRLIDGGVTDGMTVRDVGRAEWSRLTTPGAIEAALAVLTECGLLRVETGAPGPGRPSPKIRLRPDLHVLLKSPRYGTDKTDKTPLKRVAPLAWSEYGTDKTDKTDVGAGKAESTSVTDSPLQAEKPQNIW